MNDVLRVRSARPPLYLSIFFFLLAGLAGATLVVTNVDITGSVARWLVLAYCGLVFGAAVLVFSRLQKSLRFGLFVLLFANFFWFAMPAIRSLLGETEWYGNRRYFYAVTDEHVVRTALLLLVFLILSVFAYAVLAEVFTFRTDRKARQRPSTLSGGELIAVGSLLLLLGILPFFVYGIGLSDIIQGIFGSRAAFDVKPWAHAAFESRPLTVIGRAAMVVLGEIAGLYMIRTQNMTGRVLAAGAFLFAFTITYFDSGTRTWTVLMIIPPALVALRTSVDLQQYRRWLVLGAILAVAIMWITQFQLEFRVTGFSAEALSGYDYYFVEDNDFFAETTVAVSLVPERMDYVRESNLLLFLSNPIPRSLWSDKPYPRIVQLYSLGRRGYDQFLTDGGSSMPSIVGQHFMNWGVGGVIALALGLGVAYAWLDQLWRRSAMSSLGYLWLATTSVWLFVSFRGLLPGFHYPVVVLGTVLLVEKMIRSQRRRRHLEDPMGAAPSPLPAPGD